LSGDGLVDGFDDENHLRVCFTVVETLGEGLRLVYSFSKDL